MKSESELGKLIITLTVVGLFIIGLGWALQTDALYAEYPLIKTIGWWVAGICFGFWAVFWAIPETVRYLSEQAARGRKDAEEKNDEI